MSRWLCTFLLAASVSAHAAPPASAEEDIGAAALAAADRGLLSRLSQTVQERASGLVVTAMGFLGVPYRWGGNSAETGFDCSGFVRAIYAQTVGLILPRRAVEQAAATQAIDRRDLQPGDLVFFNTMRRAFSHVGIYVGGGRFIHAPKPGAEVRVESMQVSYWEHRFDGARRVHSAAPAPATPEQAPLDASTY